MGIEDGGIFAHNPDARNLSMGAAALPTSRLNSPYESMFASQGAMAQGGQYGGRNVGSGLGGTAPRTAQDAARLMRYNSNGANGAFYNPNQGLGMARGGTVAYGGLGALNGGMNQGVRDAYQASHGGVAMHQPGTFKGDSVQLARQQGPDQAAIQAEMQRRQVGANIGNASPQNAALAGYLMGGQ